VTVLFRSAEVQELQAQLTRAAADVAHWTAESTAVREEVEQLTKDGAAKDVSLKTLESELNELREQRASLQERFDVSTANASASSDDRAEALDKATVALQTAESTNSKLASKLQESESEIAKLSADVAASERELSELRSELSTVTDSQEATLEVLQSKMDQLKQSNDALLLQLNDANEKTRER
jgi:chromosome segregation protein